MKFELTREEVKALIEFLKHEYINHEEYPIVHIILTKANRYLGYHDPIFDQDKRQNREVKEHQIKQK